MISDLILCHKVRKLFAIIITQKEEIRSQIYRKTRFILSIEKQIFLTNCSRIFLSRIESLLLANIHIRFMNKKHLFALLFTLLVWTSCNNQQHFITDAAYRAEVENDFQAKQAALPNGNLFAVFNDQMTPEEREALTFMYAYMPIGDITDYSGDFYLKNIRSSFQARNEMPWGDSIPEDIFRHFVLPVRINNENLDESRMVFFDELKDRVKGLSLYDAVLEVNHWCHEKVIYTPSDGRTSSPLASVKTAYGRCGEESTFTVAALRSVGIPARQVYTPRWAHTDDNHAWVEAWVNGKWYFFGACEPEPVLNLGWFNGPAYRGMLMHTKVFGKYNGPEDVMERTDGYTEINVIDNYAPSAKAVITVTDANGKPVKDALVEFKIYNYAEFNSVARKIQYFKDNAWVDVDFEAAVQTTAKQGKVIASYQPIKALQDPKYYSHFTIAKVLPNGTLQTLNFERGGNVDMGLGDTWSGLLKKPLSMDEGNYMLVTGTRMANGSVLAEIEFFNVEADKTTPIQLEMRESKDEIQVIGNFNSENKFKRADNGEETSLLATTGRGYYIVALLGSRQEPTNHAMRDIAAVKKELEDWGRGIVLLFPDEKGYKNFDPKEFGDLPSTITYGLDIDGAIQKEMATAMKLQNANTLPIFLIADTFNRVVFVSQGYTIGLGEQLMKVIHKL